MTAIVTKISAIRPHGDNLSIVSVDDMEVVANRLDDGSFRWAPGEVCVYVAEGSIVPDDVLKERGYWDDVKNKGLLEGKKGNRVKMRRFAGHESRGLLFKLSPTPDGILIDRTLMTEKGLDRRLKMVSIGDDVSDFLGITEHV